jgi:hypothetical protein
VSLKYEGRDFHDYKVARAQELLTRARPFRRTEFVYDPQEGLAPPERHAAQRAIDRIFHRKEPDTVNIMAAALEEELEKLQSQNQQQRILARERDLPVKPILEEGARAIEAVTEYPQPDRRLKSFLEQADLVRELREYQDRLQGFIEAGRPAQFRQAQRLQRAVERGQDVVPALESETVQAWLDEMEAIESHQEIVEKWAAYYQNMQPLLRHYQTAYEERHQERYQTYTRVRDELEELGIPTDTLSNRLCEGPVGWSLDGLTCTSCGTELETLYYQIQSASEEKARLIGEYTPLPDDGDDEEVYALLRLYDVIQTRDITTVEELNEALSELREAVQMELDAGKHVILS